jgi:amino acid adenylation domain-containing protein
MDVRAARERRKTAHMTPMQFAIWKGQQLRPGVPLYNEVHTFRISGPLDPQAFERAFSTLVAGTDVLRTIVFEEQGAMPVLNVLDDAAIHHNYSEVLHSAEPEAELLKVVDSQKAMEFTNGSPLYDSHLVRVGTADYVWCLTLHHLIADFLSVTLLYERMSALVAGDEAETAWPEFEAYAEWLEEQQASPRRKRAASYWERNLPTSNDVAPLEVFGNTLSGNNPRSERITLELGSERSQRVEAMCGDAPFRTLSRDLGLLNFFGTVLWSFLCRTSNRGELTVGIPLHNRTSPAFRKTAGLLINILPVAETITGNDTFASVAQRLGLKTLDATKHAPFAPPQGDMNGSFDAVLNLLRGEIGTFAGMPCDFTWEHTGFADPHYAVRLQIQDFAATGEFTLYLDFNEDLLSGLERHRIAESFLTLIDACLENPEERIASTDLLTESDYARLVTGLNATAQELTKARSLNDLIRPHWQDSREETAIRFRGESISYGDLDERVAVIAQHLRAAGVGSGDVVAVWLQRSPDLIATILAILRLGAAYVPIDPAQPARRVERVLQDASPVVVVSEEVDVPVENSPVIRPSELADDAVAASEDAEVGENDAAYMIYTSGSTGEPKGVVVEQRGIVNYIAWAAEQYVHSAGIERPAMPFYSSPAVDLTLTSIFLPLVTGGSICIYEAEDIGNDLSIVDVFKEDDVDILKLTPAHLSLLQKLRHKASRIRTLILGGENLTTAAAQSALPLFPAGVAIYNEYGPTETVVGCMIHRYDPSLDVGSSVPIGRPIDNMRVYALDRHGKPVPPGVVGELYIAGTGVARGYHERAELTGQSFVALPSVGEARAYRSGDLVRFGSDGQLIYLGRRDEQLKIRGNRVELGDIVSCLQRHPQITAAGVAVEEQEKAQSPALSAEPPALCTRCGLPADFPQALIDLETGVCEICRQYDRHKDRIDGYFRERDELREIVRRIAADNDSTANAIALTSGGKDSTYALHQLVRMGLRPVVFTLDNGFISEQALDNVRKVTADLGLELVIGRTPHMNEIFADSLKKHCNVCNGCFKTIYTLSVNLAVERGINYIFTGLSRGQLFETRLAPEMFAGDNFSVEAIESNIRSARIAYHRRHDAVNERLDVSAFADETLFDRIEIVDFYRYWDVDLDEIYGFLGKEVGWVRPADTGRSTNCLINEAGISVHKSTRGYHNYALPYSWDVRLGHKTREAALHELNDEIDDENVAEMLDEIGYVDDAGVGEMRLVAAYTASQDLEPGELRQYLQNELPGYMIPNQLFQLDELPLTRSGKLDNRQLLGLASRRVTRADDTAAGNELEQSISNIWQDVLQLDRLGIYENFFDIGGTSLPALQIVARCEQAFDIKLPVAGFFSEPTVAGLAETIEGILVEQLDVLTDEEAEQALRQLESEEPRA